MKWMRWISKCGSRTSSISVIRELDKNIKPHPRSTELEIMVGGPRLLSFKVSSRRYWDLFTLTTTRLEAEGEEEGNGARKWGRGGTKKPTGSIRELGLPVSDRINSLTCRSHLWGSGSGAEGLDVGHLHIGNPRLWGTLRCHNQGETHILISQDVPTQLETGQGSGKWSSHAPVSCSIWQSQTLGESNSTEET